MKKLLIISIFTVLTFMNLKAEESKFIEVTVTDTVYLNAIEYSYSLSFGETTSFLGMKFSADDNSGAEQNTDFSEIIPILESTKFPYSIDSVRDYNITKNKLPIEIIVKVKSENDLKKLYSLFNSINGIYGKVKEVKYEPISNYYESIYTNLYTKAFKKAEIIAKTSKNSVSHLTSATDVIQDGDVFSNTYKQIMKEMPILGLGEQEITKKKEIVKMVFKFSL